jgi:hypothetical protein
MIRHFREIAAVNHLFPHSSFIKFLTLALSDAKRLTADPYFPCNRDKRRIRRKVEINSYYRQRLIKFPDLTFSESDIGFNVEARRESVSLRVEKAERPTQCSVLSAGKRIHVLFQKAGRCANQACSLFILDKGKPVVRPARKAKGRR